MLTSLTTAIDLTTDIIGLANCVTVGSSGSPSLFASTSAGLFGSSEVSVTSVPSGSVPSAVAVLVILPDKISAAVISYIAVYVPTCPGANTGDTIGAAVTPNITSVTVIPLTVTFPVFVTVNVYVIISPALITPSTPASTLEVFANSI